MIKSTDNQDSSAILESGFKLVSSIILFQKLDQNFESLLKNQLFLLLGKWDKG